MIQSTTEPGKLVGGLHGQSTQYLGITVAPRTWGSIAWGGTERASTRNARVQNIHARLPSILFGFVSVLDVVEVRPKG